MENQQRRQTWDVFGFLLMMVNSQCGPGSRVHLPDGALCHRCTSGNPGDSCETLCAMKSNSHKSHYSQFCESSDSSTTTTSSSESSTNSASSSTNSVDAYVDNSTPGNVTMEGNYAKGFQFWMVAAAASVGMALVAVHLGQRKEQQTEDELMEDEEEQYDNGDVKGSVGRRMAAVSAFADGVIGRKSSSKQVELSEYQLEDSTLTPPPASYPQSSFV